uniref:NR LBD domain-containing protein n=1 Tax=Caenorhabditis tropicalis TaxID=1561998 RepID=A0A1I7TRM0_9PELO
MYARPSYCEFPHVDSRESSPMRNNSEGFSQNYKLDVPALISKLEEVKQAALCPLPFPKFFEQRVEPSIDDYLALDKAWEKFTLDTLQKQEESKDLYSGGSSSALTPCSSEIKPLVPEVMVSEPAKVAEHVPLIDTKPNQYLCPLPNIITSDEDAPLSDDQTTCSEVTIKPKVVEEPTNVSSYLETLTVIPNVVKPRPTAMIHVVEASRPGQCNDHVPMTSLRMTDLTWTEVRKKIGGFYNRHLPLLAFNNDQRIDNIANSHALRYMNQFVHAEHCGHHFLSFIADTRFEAENVILKKKAEIELYLACGFKIHYNY